MPQTLLAKNILVGQAGFEPTAPTTPRWCATKLRYCPKLTKPILSRMASRVNIIVFPIRDSIGLIFDSL